MALSRPEPSRPTPRSFRPFRTPLGRCAVLPLGLVLLVACEPRVKVEAPDKPIVINLNVKIEQEVRIKVERDVEELLSKEENLF